MKNVNVFVFIVAPVQAYLLFSNLIKLSFRPRHLLIHKSFATREVSFEYNAEKPCNVFTFLANLEESGTGIRHEVGLAAFGIDSNIDFRYYHLVTLGKGYGTGVYGLLFFFAEHAHLRCKPIKCFLHFVCCSSSTACDIAVARSCSSFSTVSSSTATFFFMTLYFTIFAMTKQ